MCYSAQIQQEYRKYVRMFGAHISIREYVELYWERAEGSKAKIPKAIDAWFADLESDDHRKIRTSIERFNQAQRTSTEQVLFQQRTRLAKAERALEAKPTKAAAEDKRISQNKIQAALRKLEDLQRVDSRDSDARIFPGGYPLPSVSFPVAVKGPLRRFAPLTETSSTSNNASLTILRQHQINSRGHTCTVSGSENSKLLIWLEIS